MTKDTDHVQIRSVNPEDLDFLFNISQDPESNELAKVFPRSRESFDEHWAHIRQDPAVAAYVILYQGSLAGMINVFGSSAEHQVGYWIDRQYWGKGIATQALKALLKVVVERPLHARVAIGNHGSIRVLERCGFIRVGTEESLEDERYAACTVGIYQLCD